MSWERKIRIIIACRQAIRAYLRCILFNMKPIIGISLDIVAGELREVSLKADYFQSVLNAGGLPVLIPPMGDADLDQILQKVSGLVFVGGNDYSPESYGESLCRKIDLIDPTREEFDLRFMRKSLQATKLPILGICGGMQLMNIVLGGTLIQDIASEYPESKVQHPRVKKELTMHEVILDQASNLFKIYGKEKISVPTSHHQAVKKLGSDLQATAFAEDGIVEAIEHNKRPFTIGVQWHPERDYAQNKNLFAEFIKQAQVVLV